MGRGLLNGKVALVTGAGQGLGRAVAREFADEGAAVALVDIDPTTATAVEKELLTKGYPAKAYPLDVTDYDAYAKAIADVVERWGHLDILVNNAAITIYGTILEDKLEDWRRQIQVNLEAYYMGSKMVVPYMVKQKYGRVINITSIQGFLSSGTVGAYNAAKGGIIALTKSMAVELAPYNIAVNAVAPGFMHTQLSFVDGVDETTTEPFLKWYVEMRHVPMARSGEPEDDAGAVVFLASDYCRYMTGQVLVVDGGLTSTF
jgi:3-oxoacyl-[acyl-carrier protein] reductase